MSDNIFTGTIPALMTPCKADRTPDYDALVKAWGGEEFVALHERETFAPAASKTYTVVGVMPATFAAFTEPP